MLALRRRRAHQPRTGASTASGAPASDAGAGASGATAGLATRRSGGRRSASPSRVDLLRRRVRPREGALGLLLAVRHFVAVVDPHLHADDAERGLGLGGAEVDLGAQGVQGHTALAVPLAAAHLGPTEPAAGRDSHAERARAHRRLHRTAHGATERDPPRELLRDALGEQGGIGLGARLARGLVHVFDLHVDALLGVALDVLAQPIDFCALAADHDAGTRGADEDPDLVALALDVDRADAGTGQPRTDVLADPDVLVHLRGVVAPAGVPVGFPGVDDPQPEPVRVDLVTH